MPEVMSRALTWQVMCADFTPHSRSFAPKVTRPAIASYAALQVSTGHVF